MKIDTDFYYGPLKRRGVLTFTVMSTLASGGVGGITVKGTGVHFNGPIGVV